MNLKDMRDVTLGELFELGFRMQRMKGADKNYSITITGEDAGQILFIEDGEYSPVKRAKDNHNVYGDLKRQKKQKGKHHDKSVLSNGVLFDGSWYKESRDIPASSNELFEFELTEDRHHYVLTGFNKNLGDDKPDSLSLPTMHRGKDIIAVADFSFSNEGIKELYIPGNIVEVGEESFSNNLIGTLVIEEGVEFIQQYAFIDNNLIDMVLPTTMSFVNTRAFGNNNLANVSILSNDTEFGGSVFANNGVYKNSQSITSKPFSGKWRLQNNAWVK